MVWHNPILLLPYEASNVVSIHHRLHVVMSLPPRAPLDSLGDGHWRVPFVRVRSLVFPNFRVFGHMEVVYILRFFHRCDFIIYNLSVPVLSHAHHHLHRSFLPSPHDVTKTSNECTHAQKIRAKKSCTPCHRRWHIHRLLVCPPSFQQRASNAPIAALPSLASIQLRHHASTVQKIHSSTN